MLKYVKEVSNMLINRLSILLAERSERANTVSHKTGIARSTLSSLTNNLSKMIQFDTVNTLCRYLGVTPADFFEYAPVDFSFKFSFKEDTQKKENSKENVIKEIAGTVECSDPIKHDNIKLNGSITATPRNQSGVYHVFIDIGTLNSHEAELFNYYKEQLSNSLYTELKKLCEREIYDLIGTLENPLVVFSPANTVEYRFNF